MGFMLIVPRHVNTSAKQRAEEFCNSVQIGEPSKSLAVKAQNLEAAITSWQLNDGKIHHQAWFSGFLANAFSCEVHSKDGQVISRFTEEHTW